MNNHKHIKGFSLIEILIFVTVTSIFFVTAIAIATASLRNMKINEHKILATKYEEELYEWLTSEKEIAWKDFPPDNIEGFYNKAVLSSETNQIYCFGKDTYNNDGNLTWPSNLVENAEDCSYNLGNPPIFRRWAQLIKTEDSLGNVLENQVDVKIHVEWMEGNKPYNVYKYGLFSIWE